MADSAVPTNLRVKQWDDKFFVDYVRNNRFSKYFGTGESSMIQVKENLMKKPGDTLYFELINKLAGAGVTDNATLEGNEAELTQRSHSVTVHQYRHGVRIPSYEEQATAIDLRDAARTVLMDWALVHTRNKIITALGSKNGTAYGTVSEANKDAWLVDNAAAGRVLFGDSVSNGAKTDHSADLATVTAAMTLDADIVGIMKRLAQTGGAAGLPVRPIRTSGDEEWYVLFANSWAFRDLKASLSTIHQNAEVRGKSNPLFTGNDLVYDGVIIREIPEIATLGAVGATSAVVSPVFLCGAQALGVAYAKRWASKTETFDYGDKYGVAVAGTYEVSKLTFGKGATDTDDLIDHGVVTGYVGTVASN